MSSPSGELRPADLADRGRGLQAGQIVISGGLTGQTDLTPGMCVTLEIHRLGAAE